MVRAKKWPSKEGDAISIRSDSLWGNSSRCPVQSSPGAFSSATGPLAPEGDTRRETNTRCVQEAPLSYLFEPHPKNLKLAPEILYGQTRGDRSGRKETRNEAIADWELTDQIWFYPATIGRHEGLKTHCTGVRSRRPRLEENRSIGFSAQRSLVLITSQSAR